MSLIDDTFGGLASKLIGKFKNTGPVVFVQTGASSLDPATGIISRTEARTTVNALVLKLKRKEFEGVYQTNDVIIYPDPTQFSGPITQQDFFEYPDEGQTIKAKVIMPLVVKGDNAVYYKVLARPQ